MPIKSKRNVGIFTEKSGILVFIAVFFSSMLGAKIFGVSLNKLALIPLEIYLIFRLMKHRFQARVTKTKRILLLWYFAVILSSLAGFVYPYRLSGTDEKLILNILQCGFIYIPILLGIEYINNPIEQFRKAIVVTAKINSIIAVLQFLFWYLVRFDFNDFIFGTVLRGLLGNEWTVWNYEMGSLAIRATGLNHDAAYFAMIMIIGFCFCKEKIWKAIFFVATLLAMSRVGVLTILLLEFISFAKIKTSKTIKKRSIFFGVFGFVMILIGAFYAYLKIPAVQYQVDYFIYRLSALANLENADNGTLRHVMYIPESLITLLDMNLLHILFGVGARVSGAALLHSSQASSMLVFTVGMRNAAWSIECDFAELLLGTGVVGFTLFYIYLFRLYYKSKDNVSIKNMIVALIVFGFMYNSTMNTVVNLFLIFAASFSYENVFFKIDNQMSYEVE